MGIGIVKERNGSEVVFLQKSLRSGLSSSFQLIPYDGKKKLHHKEFIYMHRLTHCTRHIIKETYEQRAFQVSLTQYLCLTTRTRGLVLHSLASEVHKAALTRGLTVLRI